MEKKKEKLEKVYGVDGVKMLETYFSIQGLDLFEDVDEVIYYWKKYTSTDEYCREWLEDDEPQIMEFRDNDCILSLPDNSFIKFVG